MAAVIIEAMTWRRAAVIEVDSIEGNRGRRAEIMAEIMAEIALELRLDETRGGAVEGPLEGGERLLLLTCETRLAVFVVPMVVMVVMVVTRTALAGAAFAPTADHAAAAAAAAVAGGAKVLRSGEVR